MERYFHAEILEQKRQKERQQRNQNSKARLQDACAALQGARKSSCRLRLMMTGPSTN